MSDFSGVIVRESAGPSIRIGHQWIGGIQRDGECLCIFEHGVVQRIDRELLRLTGVAGEVEGGHDVVVVFW